MHDPDRIVGGCARGSREHRFAQIDFYQLQVERDQYSRPPAGGNQSAQLCKAGETRAETLARFAGGQFSVLKNELVELAVARVAPITAEMNRLMADPGEIDRILRRGAERAGAIAIPHLAEVHDIIGILRP